MFRRFVLVRALDVSGVSGTGTVAEGIQFGCGRVVLRWCAAGRPRATNHYDSVQELEEIHGHGGSTRVEWVDAA